MRCSGFSEDDYAFYALGALPESVRMELEEHLTADCETCTAEMARSRRLWYSVALATPQAQPSRELRRKLLASVAPPAPALQAAPAGWFSRLTGPGKWGLVLAGASAVILSVVIAVVILTRQLPAPALTWSPVYPAPVIQQPNGTSDLAASRVPALTTPASQPAPDPAQAHAIDLLKAELSRERDRNAQLEADIAQQKSLLAAAQTAAREADRKYLAAIDRNTGAEDLQKRLATATARAAELERQVSQYRVLLEMQRNRLDQSVQAASMLSDPSLRIIRLRGTEKGPSAQGHAVIAGAGQMVFYGAQLPPLPANRTYQLWLVRAKGPAIASAGTFRPDPSSHAVVQLRNAALLAGVTTLAVTDEPEGGSAQPTGHKWLIGS